MPKRNVQIQREKIWVLPLLSDTVGQKTDPPFCNAINAVQTISPIDAKMVNICDEKKCDMISRA